MRNKRAQWESALDTSFLHMLCSSNLAIINLGGRASTVSEHMDVWEGTPDILIELAWNEAQASAFLEYSLRDSSVGPS